MIDFINGSVAVRDKIISTSTNYEQLSALAEKGLIEKREDAGGVYYYFESQTDAMRFGIIISLRNKRIEWLLLRWLDRPMKSWNDVSEEAMIDEFRLISNFAKKKIGVAPNKKNTGTRSWCLKWGQLNVSYEIRSCEVAIFMTPR